MEADETRLTWFVTFASAGSAAVLAATTGEGVSENVGVGAARVTDAVNASWFVVFSMDGEARATDVPSGVPFVAFANDTATTDAVAVIVAG
jgi:hypothetical protein